MDGASPGLPAARGFSGRGTLVKWKCPGHTGRRTCCFQGSVFGYACSAMVLCVYVSSVFSYETVASVCVSEPHCTRLCPSPSLHAHLHARGSFPVSEPPCPWPVPGRCCLRGPGQSRVALWWAGCQAGLAGSAASPLTPPPSRACPQSRSSTPRPPGRNPHWPAVLQSVPPPDRAVTALPRRSRCRRTCPPLPSSSPSSPSILCEFFLSLPHTPRLCAPTCHQPLFSKPHLNIPCSVNPFRSPGRSRASRPPSPQPWVGFTIDGRSGGQRGNSPFIMPPPQPPSGTRLGPMHCHLILTTIL